MLPSKRGSEGGWAFKVTGYHLVTTSSKLLFQVQSSTHSDTLLPHSLSQGPTLPLAGSILSLETVSSRDPSSDFTKKTENFLFQEIGALKFWRVSPGKCHISVTDCASYTFPLVLPSLSRVTNKSFSCSLQMCCPCSDPLVSPLLPQMSLI